MHHQVWCGGETIRQELDTLDWNQGSLYIILLRLFIHMENGMIQVLQEVSMWNSSANSWCESECRPILWLCVDNSIQLQPLTKKRHSFYTTARNWLMILVYHNLMGKTRDSRKSFSLNPNATYWRTRKTWCYKWSLKAVCWQKSFLHGGGQTYVPSRPSTD